MSKTDIKSAFRIVPVDPADYHLLGFKWRDGFYYDRCLPMGCSSSCAIFESISTGLEWIIKQRLTNVSVLHILDDFLFIGPSYQECQLALDTFISICHDIGIPLAPEKTIGPIQGLEFAGIYLDSVDMSAKLPQEKVTKFLSFIHDMVKVKSANLKQIQSLAGMLNFACEVIVPARAFSRRLIDLSLGLTQPYHHRKVTNQVREDLLVWKNYLLTHNSKTFFLDHRFITQSSLQLFTDSSSTIGYGGYYGSRWFAGLWPATCMGLNIALLEIYPICLAIKVWGSHLSNKCIMFNSDNMSVVHIVNNFTSKDPNIMALLRIIVLDCMRMKIYIRCTHIAGRNNVLADMLSRSQVALARTKFPHLQPYSTFVPIQWRLDQLLKL